jgi:hypothetical protein
VYKLARFAVRYTTEQPKSERAVNCDLCCRGMGPNAAVKFAQADWFFMEELPSPSEVDAHHLPCSRAALYGCNYSGNTISGSPKRMVNPPA